MTFSWIDLSLKSRGKIFKISSSNSSFLGLKLFMRFPLESSSLNPLFGFGVEFLFLILERVSLNLVSLVLPFSILFLFDSIIW